METNHRILSGSEQFESSGIPVGATVLDFWAWSQSRLLADGPRGDLAEFIVNTALGVDTTMPKHGWGECDIVYPLDGNEYKIEIKCSSYLQAWERTTPTKPVFSIKKTMSCDVVMEDNRYVYHKRENDDKKRRSDIYVFCYYATKDRNAAIPWDLSQWEFYVLPTYIIDERYGDRRSASLDSLMKTGAVRVVYERLKETIDATLYHLPLNL